MALLDQFRDVQNRVERVAHTPDAQPASKLLTTEGAPRAQRLFEQMSRLIELEADREAMPERMQLLKAMADMRGTTALSFAELRAFLLTGEAGFRQRFEQLWQTSERHLGEVRQRERIMNETQRAEVAAIAALRGEFRPIAERMFEIRASDQWNVPIHLLRTEAAPRADKILDLLEGPAGADRRRGGGMIDNQLKLLTTDAAQVDQSIDLLQILLWTLLGVGLGVAATIAVLTSRSIVNPVAAMTDAMRRLAGGDKTVAIPARERRDEIGAMASAVQVFKDTAIEAERLAQDEVKAQAARAQRATALDQLTTVFDSHASDAIRSVAGAAEELQALAQSMSSTAEETSRQAAAVAAASEQATTNVQTVASAAEELSSSVAEISRQVTQSTAIASRAVEDARRTNATVQSLAEAAQRIDEVVKLISDIAAQTNLLALNATIEAARAGDAGKGFAVVASEVKSLANQTGKATGEIVAQISAIQSATRDAVEAIRGIGGTIEEINGITTSIASAIEEQGAATQEIARNVQQAAAGTQEVSANIEGVRQAASETGGAASQVLGASGELSRHSEGLRQEIETFLGGVKAA